jgi:hypothetical protein
VPNGAVCALIIITRCRCTAFDDPTARSTNGLRVRLRLSVGAVVVVLVDFRVAGAAKRTVTSLNHDECRRSD